jgi:sugar lactone lactonase YvrE
LTAEARSRAEQPTTISPEERERRRRKVLLLLALLLLLFLVFWALRYYLRSREVPLPTVTSERAKILTPPQFLFLFDGSPQAPMRWVTDVKVHPQTGNIYVSDTANSRVSVFSPQGEWLFSFSKLDEGGQLRRPLYFAFDKAGNVYVTDRLLHGLYVFTPRGKFVRQVFPNGEINFKWAPIALYRGKDEMLYVSDILGDHRILALDSEDKVKLSFGTVRQVQKVKDLPGVFSFPNSIVTDKKGRIFVSDSDNRRLQVFDSKGKFLYIIETRGLPRGIDIGFKDRLHIVDTPGHNILVYSLKGTQLLTFGTVGIGLGEMAYPNGIDTVGRRIYIADTVNNRIQVFAWRPEIPLPAPIARGVNWLKYLLPLALLAWLLRPRPRIFVSDEPFLQAIVDNRKIRWLKYKVRKVHVSRAVFEKFKLFRQDEIDLKDVMKIGKYKKDLASRLMHEYKIDEETAIVLATAKGRFRKGRVLTEIANTKHIAEELKLVAYSYEEFIEKYEKKPGARGTKFPSDKPTEPPAEESSRCQARTRSGEQCQNRALKGSKYCKVHQKKEE